MNPNQNFIAGEGSEEVSPKLKAYIDDQIALAIKMHRHDGTLTQNVYFNQIIDNYTGQPVGRVGSSENLNIGQLVITAATNGTTPVSVFGTTNPFFFQITAFVVLSLDSTAGTITLKNGSDTVGTVAKGASPTLLFGSVNINGSFINATPGTDITVESSTAGNAVVFLFLQLPTN